MNEISISVYHIIHFTQIIDKTFASLEQLASKEIFDNGKNEELRRMILINANCQILILTDSLFEEYSKYFIVTQAKTQIEKDKIEQTIELLKPVFKKINEWDEIKDFRNNILAHNLRVQKSGYTSVFTSKGLSGYNIPEKPTDFAFLVQCIDLIKQIIYKMFRNEYDEVVSQVNLKNEETKNNVPLAQRDYKKEYEQLRNEIWKRKEQIETRFSQTP